MAPDSVSEGQAINLTKNNWWFGVERFPKDHNGYVDVQNLLRGAINAALYECIPPPITEVKFRRLVDLVGPTITIEDQVLTLTYTPFINGDGDGRVSLAGWKSG